MKTTLFAPLFFALLVICISVVPAQALPIVSLDVLDSNIITGESFDVEVWVDGDGIGEDLLGFGFDVVTAGTFFSYDSYVIEPGFFDVSDPFNPNNVAGGFSAVSDDDVLLATLSFTALDSGTDSLEVLGLNDGLFYGLFYEFSGPDIDAMTNITITPIPEPATILLLGTGIAGFFGFRKKFRKR